MIQKDKRFKFTICLLIMQVLSSSVQDERTNGRNALQTLKYNIRMHGKYKESKSTKENTVFRITGEAYELDDFCQIYDSLHGHSNPEEMLSIITIRDIHVNKHYSSEDYMQYFIKGIQEYINQNEDIVLQNSLGIAVNCVKRAHITEFEHLNINLELNYTIRQRVREYIINHFHDICLDGMKEIFVKKIYSRFERQQQFFRAEISTDEVTLNKVCNKDFDKIIAGMKQFVASYNFHKELQWNFEAEGSAFDVVYSQICDHETNLGVKNFTDNRADLMKVYSFILKEEFMELYKDGINRLATMYLSIFDMQYCRKVFGNHYKAICKRLLNHFTNNWPYNDYIYSEMCILYCTNDYFTSKIQSFFTEIQSNDIKKEHLEKYRDSLDLLRQKTTLENVTKIVFNGHIDNEKISLLLDILQHYEIFDKPYRHQTVYIDSGRGLTEIEAPACAKKCNELVFECSDAIKTVELITIIKPTLEPLSLTPLKCFKHKREVIGTSDKFRQSFENIHQEGSETKITIGKFFNSGSAIDACIFCHWIACLIRNDSVPRCSKMVSFENNFTSSFVIILLHKHNNTKQEIISLIYNMPYTSHSICDETICNDKRLIQCMDNVPLSFLKKLSMSIQSEQYWKSVQLNNPNLASRCNYDIVFSEDFLSIYYMRNKSNILDSYLATFYKPKKKYLYKMRFSIREVVDFERKGKYDNANLASTADNLKIPHAEFNQLLLKFLSNKGFHALERTDPTEIDYLDHSGEIDFLLSIHKNTGDNKETFILHLVETNDKYYALQPKFNPIKNLSRIIDLSKNILSIQEIEYAMKSLNSKTSFIGLVLCDVCMQTKYIVRPNGEPSFPMGKKECFSIILKQLENVLQSLHKTKAIENCSGELVMLKRQKTEDLQKDIVPTELEAFAEIIARELNHSTRYAKLRIMSMKLKARNEQYYQRKEFIDSHKIYEQLEDLKRWTGVFVLQ